ncbi:hypothetical protein PGH45_00040 [Legionella pneumophila]|nr:hypothetical protein [Legionella pneumophila]
MFQRLFESHFFGEECIQRFPKRVEELITEILEDPEEFKQLLKIIIP